MLLFYNNVSDILTISYIYLYFYNFTLILLFWLFQQFISFNFKTLYSFNDFKFDYFYTTITTVCLFSMAGVPPFLGFFTKLLLLLNLINNYFNFVYIFFFILLFFGLYFYLQNLRFLYSSNQKIQTNLSYSYEINMRNVIIFSYGGVIGMFFLSFGFLFFDDFLLYFFWLFV